MHKHDKAPTFKVTQINKELTEMTKELNKTVQEQKQMMANNNGTIEELTAKNVELEAKNAEQDAAIRAINSSLSMCNCQNSKSEVVMVVSPTLGRNVNFVRKDRQCFQ